MVHTILKEKIMDWKTYQEEAERTTARLEPAILNNLHYTMGLATEVGELLDVFKKHIAYGKPIDWVNVQEECGDFLWYFFNFLRINGFDFEEILQKNIDKLYVRYPEKFDADKANNRDLLHERKILEE